jgi:hypothetical protein
MSLTIDLTPEAEARLREEAGRVGVDPADYARRVIERHFSSHGDAEASLALLAAWDAEDATDDPRELEARRREWEEFKQAMNSSHSSYRRIYP